MAEQPKQGKGRRGGIVFPVVLILVGAGFLAANLGIIPSDWWRWIWRLWPLLLVLLGLEIILGWRRSWGGVALALVTISIVLGFGLALASWQGFFSSEGRSSEDVSQELGALKEGRIEIEFGAGELTLDSLSKSSGMFLTGDLEYQRGGEVGRSFNESEGKGVYRLTGPESSNFLWFGGGTVWDISLTQRVPFEVDVKAGAASIEMDLRALLVEDLRLDFGAGSCTVRFPRQAGFTRAVIKTGASSLTVEIPEGVAARIDVDVGLGPLNIDEDRFPRSGDVYMSPNYETAENKLDLEVDGGVSSLTIR